MLLQHPFHGPFIYLKPVGDLGFGVSVRACMAGFKTLESGCRLSFTDAKELFAIEMGCPVGQ